MKPTDEERRKVAARLRELAVEYEAVVPSWSIIACGELPAPIDDVMQACGAGRCLHASEVCTRLADLIEPEERTCRAEERYCDDGSSPLPHYVCVCSECGEMLHYRDAVTEYGEES